MQSIGRRRAVYGLELQKYLLEKHRTSPPGDLSGGTVVTNPADAEDAGLIPGLGRIPGEGHGSPLQYSYLGNSMNRGA